MIIENLSFIEVVNTLKSTILSSRYKVAMLANKEVIHLYLSIGKLISEKTHSDKWGSKVIESISNQLQTELPGLRGFSASNLKKMRLFFEVWSNEISIRSLPTNEINTYNTNENRVISSSLPNEFIEYFNSVTFTHHFEIISKTTKVEERFFYIKKTAIEFWSVATLKHHLTSKLYFNQSSLPNNFENSISNLDLRKKALSSFKDEYLLDFINLEDPEEENERLIESEIIRNIKKFLMSMGTDFAFIGNQYRFVFEEKEYFIDLLFYNRKLQSLVAFDLKKGMFKPEYLGKMNFYLSALDELVKLPNENPSIGIILCKEKNNKVVEFSFRDFNKAMGVSIYKTANQLPKKYEGLLPDENILKKLMK